MEFQIYYLQIIRLINFHRRVLIYKIVLHITKHKIILTIAEAILSRHTTFHIESFLSSLKWYCKENRIKWPMAKRYCCDVSYPLINAILKIYNNHDISGYLDVCFEFCRQAPFERKIKPNFIIVQWCKCHYIKIICDDLDKNLKNQHTLRNFLKKS